MTHGQTACWDSDSRVPLPGGTISGFPGDASGARREPTGSMRQPCSTTFAIRSRNAPVTLSDLEDTTPLTGLVCFARLL